MHTVAGLLELGEHDEALSFIERVTAVREELAARLTEQVRRAGRRGGAAGQDGVRRRARRRAAAAPRTPRCRPARGADPEALVTVVGNLVDNAVEALGGGRRRGRGAAGDVVDGVRVEVRDSGPGRRARARRRGVPPRLHHEDRAVGRVAAGSGLALTRQACVHPRRLGRRAQRGRRRVHGVPAVRPGVARAVIGVLVVDDDFMVARIHRGYVEKLPGFRVARRGAHRRRRRCRRCRRSGPDLVLLDIYLPDRSGLEVLRELRARCRASRPDVIVITAARDVETVARGDARRRRATTS